MFSGIVQKKAPVVSLQTKPGLTSLQIDLGDLATDLQQGASVAVSGVCLTVTNLSGTVASFDMMGETLAKTTLGTVKLNGLANIERSLRAGDEIGGHRVSGHVTGMATITQIEQPLNNWIITFQCNPAWMPYILPKGFIALDGCSLTIVDIGPDYFTVHLIPETLRITTFGEKRIGDKVNLEIDPMTQAIVDTVKRYLVQP